MRFLGRRKHLAQGVGLSLLTWGVLAVCILTFPPELAIGPALWLTFITIGLAATFLYIKAYLMGARSRRVTRLGAALIAANVTFAAAYQLSIGYRLWPAIATTALWRGDLWHLHIVFAVPHAVLLIVDVVMAWGVVELARTEDPMDGTLTEDPYLVIDQLRARIAVLEGKVETA